MQDPTRSPEGTAADLIAAALRLFGGKGFAATSTREIAAAAGTNVASIAYHFGSKAGLRRACGAEIARRMGTVLAAVPAEIPATPAQASERMELVLRAMAGFILTSRAADPIVPFMLREVGEGGPALDAVYDAMIEPMHRRFCALWAAATGQEAESERTRLLVFTVIGQLLYFRIGRPIVARRMGWTAMGPAETAAVADLLVANLRTLVAQDHQQ